MNILDQNGRLKGKVSRPKASTDEFISSKRSFCTKKGDLFAFEMGAKQLPRQFYAVLRSRRGGGGEIYEEFMTNSEEHRRTRKS